ncbi:uncharacterized protein ARMOST_02541 [Armillaria ostoyae]|uniref:Uncharacterized protein n=1 Tax=Armillaria ostoyae TaxID=47428 RepID=A0A284QRZ7_ARMOS|nr:uncharacterized protein ARMOST_02541 [Armillaria ostoyae]
MLSDISEEGARTHNQDLQERRTSQALDDKSLVMYRLAHA